MTKQHAILDEEASRLAHLAPLNPGALLLVVSEVEMESGMTRSEAVDYILMNSDRFAFVQASVQAA